MDKLIMFLNKIKEKPELYIGKPSLERLSAFINGYLYCKHELYDKSYTKFELDFQEYIQEFYDIQYTQSWDCIIEFFSVSKEEAFYKFYKHLEEFLKEEI